MHMSDVADRRERLPFCNVHRRLLFMSELGYTFDVMDGAIMAFVLPVVSVLWGLSSVQIERCEQRARSAAVTDFWVQRFRSGSDASAAIPRPT
jgi:hypothetical protein